MSQEEVPPILGSGTTMMTGRGDYHDSVAAEGNDNYKQPDSVRDNSSPSSSALNDPSSQNKQQQQQQQQQQQKQQVESESKKPPVATRDNCCSSSSLALNSANHTIRVLSQHVVDQIAAGEVIQRPCNALKELIENSLDAQSSEVCIHIQDGGLSVLSVSDNGIGISSHDLLLAATRHATSKLQSCDDFQTLNTFGFRGEALASISHVAQCVRITTRTQQSNIAFQQQYQYGQPLQDKPKMCARTIGTTVLVEDLFRNLPHRRASFRPNEEYQRILRVAQGYAIHVAQKGVGIVCEKQPSSTTCTTSNATTVDLNTNTLPSIQLLRKRNNNNKNVAPGNATATAAAPAAAPTVSYTEESELKWKATRDAIGHIYGAALQSQLHPLSTSLDIKEDQKAEHDKEEGVGETTDNNSTQPCSYICTGCLSDPSYSSKKSTEFLLMINDRWVECPPLKRSIEDAYRNVCGGGSTTTNSVPKPFVYLSLNVPTTHVDVNVHPTKQHVTLLYLDSLVKQLHQFLQQFLLQLGQMFVSQSVQSSYSASDSTDQARNSNAQAPATASVVNPISNPYGKHKAVDIDPTHQANGAKQQLLSKSNVEQSSSASAAPSLTQSVLLPPPSKKAKVIAPSKLIRTHRSSQAGAIEPFLVSTQEQQTQRTRSSLDGTQSASSYSLPSPDASSSSAGMSPDTDPMSADSLVRTDNTSIQHEPNCPLRRATTPQSVGELTTTLNDSKTAVDMTQPGAFAQLASQCKCRREVMQYEIVGGGDDSDQNMATHAEVRLVKQALPRPKKFPPTECSYTSIVQLRKRIHKRASIELQRKLRQAVFVGVISQYRSLLQCGEELIEINHYQLSKHMFYQLALWRFAGADLARLHNPIDIEELVGSSVQFEEQVDEKLNVPAEEDSGPVSSEGLCSAGEAVDETISDTNQMLAQQVATCLLQQSEMLLEYFSIGIVQDKSTGKIVLTSLPVLLDGHSPCPHGLPYFLLRLATEVDWTEERPCFHGVCRELGAYYAQTTSDDKDVVHQVRHALFPAVSTLLIPSQDLETDESSFRSLTALSKLFRVFERC